MKPWRFMGEWMHRPRHQKEVSDQLNAPAALPRRKSPPTPIGYDTGCAPEPAWTAWRWEKSCPYRDSNSDPWPVQSVTSRYPGSSCVIYILNCPSRWQHNRLMKVLWKIFWPVKWTGDRKARRKNYTAASVKILYSSSNAIRVIKPGRMSWNV
jgi:hypothetical protein